LRRKNYVQKSAFTMSPVLKNKGLPSHRGEPIEDLHLRLGQFQLLPQKIDLRQEGLMRRRAPWMLNL
jgi:hypothetical protein